MGEEFSVRLDAERVGFRGQVVSLSNAQIQAVWLALRRAFDRPRFTMLLRFRFDRDIANLAAPSTWEFEIFQIVERAQAEGWALELVRAAFETLPENRELALLAASLGLTSLSDGVDPDHPGQDARTATVLERIVRERTDFVDLLPFLARLAALEGQVCRIEIPEGQPQGTGFLVGPDLVLTNRHVVAHLLDGGGDPGALRARFDFARTSAGDLVRQGAVFGLADDWLLGERPHGQADLTGDPTDVPADGELDFALMRLAEPAGDQPRGGQAGPGNPPRGWIDLAGQGAPPVVGADVFILQHPEGSPLKLAMGRVTELAGGGRRLRYDANTLGGSSGSPVFDNAFRIVGLHHAGDPNFAVLASFNQAVPIAAIVAWLTEHAIAPFAPGDP